jgi:DNA-binding XRE family transcriptional regulator
LTQEEFGNAIGVSQDTVSAWEFERRNPKLEQVVAVARALGISPIEMVPAR